MPLVSVVMPVYNSAATLGAAVRSVLTQTHADLELLVTDDRSTDGSMDLLREFAERDERVLPETAPEQGGAGRARNLAIQRARGDYIAFLDSDDMWLPEKTEKQLAFAAEGDAPLTFTSYFKMDADHAGESVDWVPTDRVIRAREHVDYRAMLVRDYIGALTAMYDRTVLGTRLMPEMRKRQDYALWLSIMRNGADARGLAEPLAVYRAHQAGSLSSNKLSLVQYNWALYRRHEHLSVVRSTRALAGAAWQSLRNSRI
ncbi:MULTISPECIES: glycosyltransferase family 2 protein [Streptomyces]|uniref:Glycosyltransferase family 2 protein n=1 Tax=Streptomyces rhizosphaericola TaxID=2564098 RepID=A0ABY2PC10_9ACTN|nr:MULTISPECIES: glycosyltransferase family 2 protein [Streptomyces]MYT89730.1 glycosyltransferase [Streptomyces sp. SID8359]MYT99698.1 glycosyltransferase [Streptomyces sp. SID8350]PWS39827.1 glycosyltransferase family 2 protein [Streptomyces sp. ZEA17I]TGZ08193.1 glycosyltransferase family 2 protein [Streptomyces rhizosphaericola]SCK56411.1 Glycosyltransferases involved in cell wall biogenesis [Streptomyces sp. AmelKG-D3]